MPVPPGYFKLDSYSIPVSSCLKLPLAVLIKYFVSYERVWRKNDIYIVSSVYSRIL